MEAKERIGTWFIWGVTLLSWIELFLMLALTFRATGCNRSSEAGTQSMDIVAESVGFEGRSKNGPLQPVQQSSLSRYRRSVLNGETARWSRVPASPNGIRDSEGG
jgi:hypothetical protein